MAEAALAANKWDEASALYEEAARTYMILNKTKFIHFMLLAAQYSRSNPQRAVSLYGEVEEVYLDPNQPGKRAEIALLVADILSRQGDGEQAYAKWRECVILSADSIRRVMSSAERFLRPEAGMDITASIDRIKHCLLRLNEPGSLT